MNVNRLSIALLALAVLAGCGGGSSSNSGGRGSVPPPGSGNGGAANPPVVVNVSAGQAAAGVDVDVPAPAASPAPNATLLGATAIPAGGGSVSIDLSNTGVSVRRGTSYAIALIGDGLSKNNVVSISSITISGPSDITVDSSSIKGFTTDNGKQGLSFRATIGSNAVLGARTVLLKNPQSDITSFTGGLEVVQ